jgi:hypothetical protein
MRDTRFSESGIDQAGLRDDLDAARLCDPRILWVNSASPHASSIRPSATKAWLLTEYRSGNRETGFIESIRWESEFPTCPSLERSLESRCEC